MELETAHVCADSVPISGGEYSLGHIVFDETGDIVCLGKSIAEKMPNRSYPTKKALRNGIEDLFSNATPDETIIRCPGVSNPALELGRIDPDIREKVQRLDISVDSQLDGFRERLVSALPKQTEIEQWDGSSQVTKPTGPYAIYTDGSYYDNTGTSTIGYIIVDGKDRVVDTKSQVVAQGSDSLESELLAVTKALLRLGKVERDVKVKLHTDNHTVVSILESNRTFDDRRKQVVNETIRAYHIFEDIELTTLDRTDNWFADALAASGCENGGVSLNWERNKSQPEENVTTKYSISG
jgi:ribonuclease HI